MVQKRRWSVLSSPRSPAGRSRQGAPVRKIQNTAVAMHNGDVIHWAFPGLSCPCRRGVRGVQDCPIPGLKYRGAGAPGLRLLLAPNPAITNLQYQSYYQERLTCRRHPLGRTVEKLVVDFDGVRAAQRRICPTVLRREHGGIDLHDALSRSPFFNAADSFQWDSLVSRIRQIHRHVSPQWTSALTGLYSCPIPSYPSLFLLHSARPP